MRLSSVADMGSDFTVYLFGPFRLDAVRRTVHCDGAAVALTPRVFDVLLCLARHGGRTADAGELRRAAWGDRVVDDSNLRQTIYELRKALDAVGGQKLVVTLPMRGYRLAVPVQCVMADRPALEFVAAGPPRAPVLPVGRWAASVVGVSAALALAAALILPQPRAARRNAAAPEPHSVAVLPFAAAGAGTAQTDFAEGVSTELINALSRIGGIRVAARTSSFMFRDHPAPVGEIARALHVGAVLEGSVRRTGAHVRIDAELVDAAGFAIWSRSYDAEKGDILDAQVGIAEAVATSLQVALAAGRLADVVEGGTRNPAAYDAYLRGLKLARAAVDTASREAARGAFEDAVALDPGFAVARAWRARELAEIVQNSPDLTPAQMQPLLREALAEAGRALALAPTLALAHLARSDILKVEQDFSGAQREMVLAREDAPSDVQVLMDDVFLEAALGHARAAREAAELAVRLDPLSPAAHVALARAQRGERDFAGALASLQRAAMMGADPADIELMEAILALDRGDNSVAARNCARGEKIWMKYLCLAVADHRLGQASEAMFNFAALRAALGANGAFQYAEVYAQWHQPAEAVKWLEIAYRTHDVGLAEMRLDTLLDPIRGTPQYAAIEAQLRFPP